MANRRQPGKGAGAAKAGRAAKQLAPSEPARELSFHHSGVGGLGRLGSHHWSALARCARVKRGDVRAGILALLGEARSNGYQIMQELEQRSGGVWRPSPGSTYPALQQLEDEGLVQVEASGTGRVYELTARGRAYVKAHKEEVRAPWKAVRSASGGEGVMDLWAIMRQIGAALAQVTYTGAPAQLAEAKRLLAGARRGLYRILAEDGPGEGG